MYRDLAAARNKALAESAGQAAGDEVSSFELVQDGNGAIRVVPKKKQIATANADKDLASAALLSILAEKPGMTERELRHIFPRLFPPRAPGRNSGESVPCMQIHILLGKGTDFSEFLPRRRRRGRHDDGQHLP